MNWNTEEQSWGIAGKHIILCSRPDAKIFKRMKKTKAGFSKHNIVLPADSRLCKTTSNVCLTCWMENEKLIKALLELCSQSQPSEREGTPKLGCWPVSVLRSTEQFRQGNFLEVSCRKCWGAFLIGRFRAFWKAALTQKVVETQRNF